MFELNGITYTLQELQQHANSRGVDFDTYMKKMQDAGMIEKQNNAISSPRAQKIKNVDTEDSNWWDSTWVGRGWKAGSATGETSDLLYDSDVIAGNFKNVDNKTISDFIEAYQGSANNYVPSERMQKFMKKYNERGAGWKSFFQGFREDPTIAAELMIQSMATQASTFFEAEGGGRKAAAVGGATGLALGAWTGWGAAATGAAGALGGLATNMESAITFGELIEEELDGKPMTDENVRAILESKGTEIRNKAIARGMAIGMIEAFTGGIAGKAAKGVSTAVSTAGKATKLANVGAKLGAIGAGTVVEAVGGGLGEVGGRLAAGQEMDVAEIGFEAIAGTSTTPINVGFALKNTKAGTYKLNNEPVSFEKMQDFINTATPQQVAEAKIEIENDQTGLDAKAYEKQENAIIGSQIDARVTDQETRDLLIEKEKTRRKLEADAKKKGIFAVPGAKERLEAAESEIAEIIGRYAGIDARTKDVRARKKEAKNVRLARKQILMDKITQGVKSSKTYKNMDIETKEVDTELEARELFEENINKEILTLQEELKNKDISKEERAQIEEELQMAQEAISNIGSKKAEAGLAHGFLLEDAQTGKMTIVINKEKALSDVGGNINVAAHEFLHAILKKTFGNKSALKPASNLMRFLNDNKQLIGTDFLARLASYQQGETQNQEVFTLLSDSIATGDIKYNESFAGKLGGFISDFLTAYIPGKKIKFKDGKDVFRFVKNYNKSVQGNRIASKLVEKAQKEGIDIAEPRTEATTTPMSKEASDRVQRIYDDLGEAGAMDIIDEFKPIVGKIVDKRKDAPNFDRQLLTDEIETGKRGIFDLIREYDPESGVPLAAYINKFLPARAIEASKRVLGEEFTQDVTERVDIAAEETTTEVKAKPKPKKIVLADRLGIGEKVNEAIKKIIPTLEVKDLTFKSLKNKIPEVIGDLFGIAPKKLITNANITKKELQSSQMFISKNADLLINMLPEGATASGTARAKMAKTGSAAGLAIQQKNKIDRKQFLEVFGIVDGKPNRTDRNTSARVLALANTLGKMITNQAVRQQDLKLSNESITKLKDGKSNIMFSKDPVENVKQDSKGSFTKKAKLVGPNGDVITTIPKDKVFIEKEDPKTGLLVGDVVSIKQMEALWDANRGITWQDHMSARLNVFLDNNPQYYDAVQELFTGGVKRTAYMTKEIFEAAVPKTKKIKETDQINANRLNYTKSKKVKSNIENLDFSNEKDKTKNFIKLFKNIGNYLNKGQNMFDLWLMEELLLHSSVDQNNFFRKSAPLIGYPVDDNGNIITTQNVVEEHTPINEVIKVALGASIRNNIKDVTPLLESMISQLAILEQDDPGGKLKSSMGIDFYTKVVPRIINKTLKLKPGHAGIYRLMKHGVNPFRYKLLESGKTIAQEFGVEGMTVEDARENIIKYFEGEVSLEYNTQMSKVPFSKDINSYNRFNKAINFSKSAKPSRGITVLDFDDTLATTKSLVRYTAPDGTTGTLNAEQYASTYEDLQDQGYTFDFSDFNKVVKGKLAPLFNKAMKLQSKFGPENMFVLTARPPAAQKAIFDFLKANGLNIPLKNITGLGNSTSEAKALWMADKVAEGYNDFYFADDALQNVQAVKNMLDQFDVKSKIQQAKVNFSKDINSEFNKILEEVTGIKADKRFSDVKARKRGENKGKFRFFIPPSHEDFVGLLYNFMGKGRKGDQHRNFFEQALVKPLNRAYREIDTAKQAIANDYKSLNKQFPNVNKKLTKKTPDGDFTFQDAIRVYLWDKHGYDIPGLSKTDKADLVEIVTNDSELQAYADALNIISKQETYVDPGPNWETGNIRIDLIDATGRVGRASYFTEFNENAEIIFSPENLNKIEAAYGKGVREALEDMLHRIKTGVNRPKGSSAKPNMLLNWLNASVSGVMFFNTRSALLQQLSNVNFINFADNNIYAAGKAFANQKQYWNDFAMIFNSDMLKQRRGGLQTDINGAELAEAVKKARPGNLFDQVAIITGKALKLGFLPTQIGDSIAIATGGATFYRNRVNKYIKDGLSKKEAEAKAFTDLQDITNSTQQSARPDMTSMQQAAVIGKVVLNFLNTPSQYNRIIKKAGSDIINRRITPPNTTQMQSDMSNMSRILYYGAAQNLIFYGLQTALFAVMFGLDDEDEQEKAEQFLKKKERVINGSIDTILRGSGVYGVAVSTIKNMIIKFLEQREKGYNKDESAVIMEMLNFSPVVGIKARKIVNAEKTLNYNKKVIDEMETFDIDNPMWSAVTNYIEVAGPPANRIYQKTINLRNASDNQYTAFQRAMFLSGYTTWSLGLGDNQKIEDVKEKIKDKKKKKSSKGGFSPKKFKPKTFKRK